MLLETADEELEETEDDTGTEDTTTDELVVATDDAPADEVVPPQMLPVITGRSALPPRLST